MRTHAKKPDDGLTGAQRAEKRFVEALAAGIQRCGPVPDLKPRQFMRRAARKAAKAELARNGRVRNQKIRRVKIAGDDVIR